MSRDANGNYNLPTGNPVITDTVITSDWANDTMSDIRTEITNSLDRQGRGGMLAPLKGVDGTKTTPMFSFTNEFNSGWYRAGAGDVRMSIKAKDAITIKENFVLTLTAGEFTVTSGIYNLNGAGLELDGTDLYIGDKATGDLVLSTGNLTAALVPFDPALAGILTATDVQTAIDQVSAGAQTYRSVDQTGGGDLIAGVMNEILDGGTYDLPLANSVVANAQIGISVPSTAGAFKPFVQRKGADTITWQNGSDTDMQFATPATIWLTSNGVDTWRY